MDEQVGKLISALKEKGLYDNTIIVFMGDHGYYQWEKNWWGKCTVWELSARTPLIISTPETHGKGKACNRVVELLDLCPTIVELAGLNPMPDRDGRSLVPLLNKPSISGEDWEGVAFTQFGNTRSVRTKRWRYCEWGVTDEALFDHRSDPDEYVNLAQHSEYEELIDGLRKQLKEKAVFKK